MKNNAPSVPVTIRVSNPNHDRETSFGDLVLRHVGTTPHVFKRSRDPATTTYSLTCSCGLALAFPSNGQVVTDVQLVAISGQPRTLTPGSYTSNFTEPCVIEPENN